MTLLSVIVLHRIVYVPLTSGCMYLYALHEACVCVCYAPFFVCYAAFFVCYQMCTIGVCNNARNYISILATKLSQLSKISRYL